jgi:hypothetical protein
MSAPPGQRRAAKRLWKKLGFTTSACAQAGEPGAVSMDGRLTTFIAGLFPMPP